MAQPQIRINLESEEIRSNCDGATSCVQASPSVTNKENIIVNKYTDEGISDKSVKEVEKCSSPSEIASSSNANSIFYDISRISEELQESAKDKEEKSYELTPELAINIAVSKVNSKLKLGHFRRLSASCDETMALDSREIRKSPIFERRDIEQRRNSVCEKDHREREVLKQAIKVKMRGEILQKLMH